MAAVAGADHKDALALPRLAVVVLAGMQNRGAAVTQRVEIWTARNPADAGGHDDVARPQLPFGAVRPAQHNMPSLLFVIIHAALKFGGGPTVELHAFCIGLEPGGKLVFWNVDR